MLKMLRKRDEGFTLVELMVVVLIIGILVAIAIPVFNSARASAQKSACQASQRTVASAVQQFNATQTDGTTVDYTSIDTLKADLVSNYVKVWPTCPAGGTYSTDAAGSGGIKCSIAEHAMP